jgi:preprotein translocase subunit SecG
VETLANILTGLIFFTSLVLILLILIQRGRGGGLIGALGGTGGSSPFGSRAGDTFTRITLIVAAVWMLLMMIQIWVSPQPIPPP